MQDEASLPQASFLSSVSSEVYHHVCASRLSSLWSYNENLVMSENIPWLRHQVIKHLALVTQCIERLVNYWQTRSTCASISIEKRDWFINRFFKFPVNSKLFPSTSQMKKILYSNDCTDCYLFVSNSISLKSRFRPSARESRAKQCQYALQTNQIYRCTLAGILWSLGSLEKLTN